MRGSRRGLPPSAGRVALLTSRVSPIARFRARGGERGGAATRRRAVSVAVCPSLPSSPGPRAARAKGRPPLPSFEERFGGPGGRAVALGVRPGGFSPLPGAQRGASSAPRRRDFLLIGCRVLRARPRAPGSGRRKATGGIQARTFWVAGWASSRRSPARFPRTVEARVFGHGWPATAARVHVLARPPDPWPRGLPRRSPSKGTTSASRRGSSLLLR